MYLWFHLFVLAKSSYAQEHFLWKAGTLGFEKVGTEASWSEQSAVTGLRYLLLLWGKSWGRYPMWASVLREVGIRGLIRFQRLWLLPEHWFMALSLKSLWCSWLRAGQKVKATVGRLHRLINGLAAGFLWPSLCKGISMLIAFSGIFSSEG